MKAIVTGANGFIGAYLVNKLLDEGIDVLAMSRKFDNNIIKQSDKLRKIEFDASNIKQIESKINYGEYELFYHLAWDGLSGEARTDESIQMNNALMTVACLKTASKIGCKKFICAGSIMEFETMHITYEEVSNSEVTNCYGASKMLAHTLCKSIANSLGIELIWGYITNAYGIGEISLRFINTTLTKILNKEDLNFTSATQNYDFVYVTDIAKALYLMGLYGKNNKCYMIGSGNAKTLKEFILDICKMFPEAKKPKFGSVPFNGINLPLDIYSIKELENDCKFKCDVTFEKGIKMTMDWLGGGIQLVNLKRKNLH